MRRGGVASVYNRRICSNSTAGFCVDALEEAIARFGAPEIFNTDQGSQFTAAEFVGVLKRHEIRISMRIGILNHPSAPAAMARNERSVKASV